MNPKRRTLDGRNNFSPTQTKSWTGAVKNCFSIKVIPQKHTWIRPSAGVQQPHVCSMSQLDATTSNVLFKQEWKSRPHRNPKRPSSLRRSLLLPPCVSAIAWSVWQQGGICWHRDNRQHGLADEPAQASSFPLPISIRSSCGEMIVQISTVSPDKIRIIQHNALILESS
jgi:hypothetical protein